MPPLGDAAKRRGFNWLQLAVYMVPTTQIGGTHTIWRFYLHIGVILLACSVRDDAVMPETVVSIINRFILVAKLANEEPWF